ncbi:peptidylprolyl isomerase [Sebaldella sp. S0638]|uniref:peptidylprolyl isomerase n=1 Tax=Sebaldella sp. S0638 TaxID=2957809 RepID=UPI00209D531A|nr:peptidylprolyl isomerase [Sebaldella sp. S0638]MCP1223611.1 peptidylprolyl isomerase [Sebaldella sp. S0638]
MALRKFKKLMVPLSVLFIAAMLVPIFLKIGESIRAGKNIQKNNEVIAEVNGHKIYRLDLERGVLGVKNKVMQIKSMKAQQGIEDKSEVPDDIVKKVILGELVSNALLASSAEDLKIKASDKEINDKVNEIKAGMPNGESFLNYLQSMGIANEKELKRMIKESIEVTRVLESQQKAHKLSDEDLKKYYEMYRYTDFQDQTFEQVKPTLEDYVAKEYSDLIRNSLIEKQREKAKIVFKDDEIKKLYEETVKPVAEKDGYSFKEGLMYTRILMMVVSAGTEYNEELVAKVRESIQKDLDNLVAVGKAAKEKGLKASPDFVGVDELRDLGKRYFVYLVSSYNPSDADLKKIYDTDPGKYDIRHSVGGYVVGSFFDPTEADKEATKKKAEDLKKTLTPENFAETAKKVSEDPGSKDQGGELGWVDSSTNFVPEFLEAIKTAQKGQIIGPVQTEFGSHLIYVEDVDPANADKKKVSHILLLPKPSEASRTDLIGRLQGLKKELDEKKVTWTDVIDQDKYKYEVKEVFKKIYENSAVPGIGFVEEANRKLFASKVNEILEYEFNGGYFLMVKTNEVPYKKRTFEEVKSQIRNEEALKYATEELDKLL